MSDAITLQVESRLDEGLAALGIGIDGEQRERLLRLVELLHKWNRAYNLTAIRSPEEMVARHLLDSAAVLPFVGEAPLLDVGAGPGLPGLVLAILQPRLAVTLLDSNGKKVRFQRQAVMELGLGNVTPVQARVEAFEPPAGGYAQVISRAFASLADFVTLTDPLLAEGGRWLAMKGPAAAEELSALAAGLIVRERHRLEVPFTAGERQLLIVERTDSNPGRP
ncbi:16S rRNA (guanine(527)-N(7))-methyltransferase RsmG [Halomonas sp. MCCC 1A17488]|uniref:Ribosomal RNA small subunit methyltransferase G n=1 Tax=Billgrantia sulfidoxydans TaxID=2733484 RepID=A0ABX7WAB9_9GAMM|nr:MULTISPECIES: 16S rRNA (guanine(527)-N(7))-methyltransferase RsmG [Halomonas]MCE8017283.1 16S rRNA (guanine(527)-N(7))-methyltransferase RsmG [Halomonas sp. MCCC 1A17488]MCG3240616.1 16S rRNA (guanine(527)-N(7))-methyltransferase RsmG [Halomonas sp. MCCC 1A17488]QPP49536.1 16S rRNA (guanine(527)-N(7))-methyltransferase RsmG [Halomonas sp. SS10-MC5]QTP56891.1 16S rRNA (guanine(527)-N(7))-methyltransferase RsmG [Halomonas sulfidoxydans]